MKNLRETCRKSVDISGFSWKTDKLVTQLATPGGCYGGTGAAFIIVFTGCPVGCSLGWKKIINTCLITFPNIWFLLNVARFISGNGA